MTVTIYSNIFEKVNGYRRPVSHLLDRIRNGRSRKRIEELRSCLDKDKAANLKKNLPSVCFSGEFSERFDDKLLKHSGLICLDFDNVANIPDKIEDLIQYDFVYAVWISPSGDGIKVLVRIADGKKHREHFRALQDVFPGIDPSGINESRVCYESYDPNIYVNEDATPFTTVKEVEKVEVRDVVTRTHEIFSNLLKWLTNKGDAFVTGERNTFIFKLASACCRFGIDESESISLINREFQLNQSTFSIKEGEQAIKSAYRSNKAHYGTATFEMGRLVDQETKREISVEEILSDDFKLNDVIYGIDVKENAISIYENGYEKLEGIGFEFDNHWKPKTRELTLLSGIGNYGKSSFDDWYKLNRAVLYGDRFGIFSPENNPAEEYYHNLTEILLGDDCTPRNPHKPAKRLYDQAYDFVSSHFFYVYPKEALSTPDYIMEKFFELIIKEKCNWFTIDPFNQLSNDYAKAGGRSDKYLEDVFSRFLRFTQQNNVYMNIIAHPKTMSKQSDGNYPEPDVFEIADGAMWNNKMDNILIYHRPFGQTDPRNPMCTITSKKIRRQKVVGVKGFTELKYFLADRRFFIEQEGVNVDILDHNLVRSGLTMFTDKQSEQQKLITTGWEAIDLDF
ncbi:hypothetical protein LL912_00705 [Niabella sp. CC-SYL272]|uniref:BT4734/BF3469 family protein n=1 Tax=Niabella agricola TaxID=2891571 RepID=UPI001F36CB03|nr:BT4734/BF3469 family protein [Niabella agricola]MCF3107286.1 hypothetical protein [Niabella agricola]